MNPSAIASATQPARRRIYLTRHAKAVEEDAGGDHVRPLSSRGIADAQALGSWLAEMECVPELVVCSTAKRTRQTLAGLGYTIPTILSDKLYLANATELLAQIQAADDAVSSLMLLGHNPGMHGILALLVGEYRDEADADRMILKFPTSACAVLSVDATHWADVTPHSARLELLRY